MTIKTKFDIGQTVTLKHDREKNERIVTGISVRDKKLHTYNLIQATSDTWHYEFEIEEKKENNKTGFIK